MGVLEEKRRENGTKTHKCIIIKIIIDGLTIQIDGSASSLKTPSYLSKQHCVHVQQGYCTIPTIQVIDLLRSYCTQ